MKRILYYTLAFIIIFVAAGCSSEPGSQRKSATRSEVRKKARSKKPAVAETKKAEQPKTAKEEYSYSSAGKPDPFTPLFAEATVPLKKASSKNQDKSFLTPLQKYALKDLKLVAVVKLNNENTGMLEDPTGYGYVIKKGMLVGDNEGVVERVTPTSLVIREKIYNSLGESEDKLSTITMQNVE
jgi:type IV pilus assembly protein PilP